MSPTIYNLSLFSLCREDATRTLSKVGGEGGGSPHLCCSASGSAHPGAEARAGARARRPLRRLSTG